MKAIILTVFLLALAGCNKEPAPPTPAPPPTVTEDLKQPTQELAASMKLFANNDELVSFIEIVGVSLTANTRQVVWYYSDSPPLQQAFENFERTKPGKTAWLIGSKEFIDKQLSILKQPYSCVAIADTRLPVQVPTVLQYVTHLCVVPVRPEPDKFSGYFSVWLTRAPTPSELSNLIAQLQTFSKQYEADQR